jgi:hypothetical protein
VLFLCLCGDTKAAPGFAESPEFALDLRGGRGTVNVGQGSASSAAFALDLRGVAQMTLGHWAESPAFTLNLLGESGGQTVSGRVFDSGSGSGLQGVSVWVGASSAITDSQGGYAFPSVGMGFYSLRAARSGYADFDGELVVAGGASVKRDIALTQAAPGSIRVTSITCKYPGFNYFLDGASMTVSFTANVDWAGRTPGKVQFLTPKGVKEVAATGGSVSQSFNMGTEFGAGGKLRAVAVGADGSRSAEKIASLIVMPPPLPELQQIGMNSLPSSSGTDFRYISKAGFNMSFFDEAMDAGIIPESIPLFGKQAMFVQFVPELECQIDSEGVATFSLKWSNAEFGKQAEEWGRGRNLKKMIDLLEDAASKGYVDRRRLPKAGMASMEFNWYPIAGGQFQYNRETLKWEPKGFGAGLAGKFELEKSWPFVFMAGPVPVPAYAKAAVKVEADAQVQALGLQPIKLNGVIHLEPYVRGSLGAGVDHVLAVEGWIGGGADLTLQYPQEPSFDARLHFNGGVTVYAFLWKWENELLYWEYPENSAAPAIWSAAAQPRKRAAPMSRDYLKVPGYAKFHGKKPKKAKADDIVLKSESGPLQTTIFPYSEPDSSSRGTNLHLVWLYDDAARGGMNRTVVVASRYDGAEWSAPAPVADDGTADFHPRVLAFSDGWTLAAWENERMAMSEGASFDAMKTNLEVAVAWRNPQTSAWLPAQNLTTNLFMDRSPLIAGPERTNVLLVWLANAASHTTGNAEEPNELLFSRWDGAQWSASLVFGAIPNPLVKYSLAYDGTNGWLAASVDLSNTHTNVTARELFLWRYQNGLWSAAERLTDNDLPDENPQLALDASGAPVMVWLNGNDLVSVVDFDMEHAQVVGTNIYCSNLADAKMATGQDGKIALSWAEPVSSSSDIVTVFHDPVFHSWGRRKQLTFDEETERSLTVSFWGTQKIIAAYNRLVLGPTNSATDLYVMEYVLGNDLSLKWLQSEPMNVGPGETAVFTARVLNNGDQTVAGVPVAFYLGDPGAGGVELGQVSLAQPLPAGEEADVMFGGVIPTNMPSGRLYAVVDPADTLLDAVRSNNVISIAVSGSDLSVESLTWSAVTSNMVSVVARVVNVGVATNGPCTIDFRFGGEGGTNVFSAALGSLGLLQGQDVSFTWELPAGVDYSELVAVIVGETPDWNEAERNNTCRLTVQKTSAVADLVMGPVLALGDGTAQVSASTEPGTYLYIETSEDLVHWLPWTNFVATNAVSTVVDGEPTVAGKRFYRAWRER